MSEPQRRDFLASAAALAAAATATFAGTETVDGGDPSFMNNVPDPLLSGKELPTFKFALEKSKGKVIGKSYGKEATVEQLPISKGIAGVSMLIEPGAMRELHWHPNADEWQYYIEGQARMGVFAASGQARTFDFLAGDVGYVPFAMGHYVENTGSTSLRFLEIFKSSYYADVSLNQWIALTPPELASAHLKLGPQFMAALRKDKVPIVPA